jgi:hypothetical protein
MFSMFFTMDGCESEFIMVCIEFVISRISSSDRLTSGLPRARTISAASDAVSLISFSFLTMSSYYHEVVLMTVIRINRPDTGENSGQKVIAVE